MSEALLSPPKHHNVRNKEIQFTHSILLYAAQRTKKKKSNTPIDVILSRSLSFFSEAEVR